MSNTVNGNGPRGDMERPGAFKTEYTIDYMSLTPDLRVSFPRLMLYVQETSLRHTDSTIYPMAWFAENQKGWVLTHWQVETCAMPMFNSRIIITTWPSHFKGFFAERGFEARDAEGNIFLRAQSFWIYTDLNKRRPERPIAGMCEGYGTVYPGALEKDLKMPEKGQFERISSREYRVTRRDLDTNLHVNNIRYIEWVFDDIPREIYEGGFPALMKVAYKRECVEGETVRIDTCRRGGEFISLVVKSAGEDILAAEVYTVWKEK